MAELSTRTSANCPGRISGRAADEVSFIRTCLSPNISLETMSKSNICFFISLMCFNTNIYKTMGKRNTLPEKMLSACFLHVVDGHLRGSFHTVRPTDGQYGLLVCVLSFDGYVKGVEPVPVSCPLHREGDLIILRDISVRRRNDVLEHIPDTIQQSHNLSLNIKFFTKINPFWLTPQRFFSKFDRRCFLLLCLWML